MSSTTPANPAKPNPFANWHSPVSEIDDPVVLQAWQDAIEDVHTRFILNLPPEELATADRIFFQIEQSWWFYEDLICDHQDTSTHGSLPRFKNLKPFAVEMFQYSPLLDVHKFHEMWETFSKYKRKISTYGCILLNPDCTKIVLCQDWNSKSWTFPAGKINQGEEGIDAAARETFEETGFDPNGKHGLASQMDQTWTHPLQEQDLVSYNDDGKHRTYYICQGVPEDFPFDPVARKEVAAVQWHPLEKIPKRNFAVLPVLPKIKGWIKRNFHSNSNNKTPKRTRDRSNPKEGRNATPKNPNTTPLKSNKTPNRSSKDNNVSSSNNNQQQQSSNRKTPNRDRKKQGSRSRSRGKGSIVREDDPLLETGLVDVGEETRWSEEAMFQANERLLGRKIEYDGNPHVFSEQGFQGNDPHHFHIVGGNFLNSGTSTLAPPPPTSRLQHLFRTKSHHLDDGKNVDNDDGEVLTPFFSDDGATPWGEVVEEVKETVLSPERKMMLQEANKAKLNKHHKKQHHQQRNNNESVAATIMATGDNDTDLVFMTDQEITERSQKIKLAQWKAVDQSNAIYQQDLQDIQEWVNRLPPAPPTKHFGSFKFKVEALMDALYQHY